jgi:PhoH-like ATPase
MHDSMRDWIPIGEKPKGKFKVIMHDINEIVNTKIFGEDKPDHRILSAALLLAKEFPKSKVILVSKDINLRLKAKALDLLAEDYQTNKIKNIQELYQGKNIIDNISDDIVDMIYKNGYCNIQDLGIEQPLPNHYFLIKGEHNSVLTFYNPLTNRIDKIEKHPVYKIMPRNAEQVFALHAILNPAVKLVTLQGIAGTGKTLLALAGAIEQKKDFRQIYLARPIVPLSNKDIGFLPGDIKSKLNPYMEPLWDNLKFIQSQFNENDKEYKGIHDMIETEKLVITPLAYIRGRSISNVCFIVDEAQNLTPHEVKTIITRAGENTKIIFTGDIYQIDTPYLDSQSNGLSYLIDKIKHHPIYAHVTLEKGERSELANLANQLL